MKFFVKCVFARDYMHGSGNLTYLMPPPSSLVIDIKKKKEEKILLNAIHMFLSYFFKGIYFIWIMICCASQKQVF